MVSLKPALFKAVIIDKLPKGGNSVGIGRIGVVTIGFWEYWGSSSSAYIQKQKASYFKYLCPGRYQAFLTKSSSLTISGYLIILPVKSKAFHIDS